MSLTVDEQRNKVVETILMLEEKNTFSQSLRYRMRVDQGYGDNVSTIQYVYRKALNINLGTYIVAQYTSNLGMDLEVANEKHKIPDLKRLEKGDLLFFRSKEKTNPYQVGHVEMYLGNNEIIGHVKGKGPTRKDMIAFCKSRNAAGKGFLKARRFILHDILDQVTRELIGRLQQELNTVGLKDQNRNLLKVDQVAGELTLSACPILRRGKENSIVAIMQEGLSQLGYDIGANGANGLFDAETTKAVKAFQKANGLKQDGIFARQEWSKWLDIGKRIE